MVRRCRPLQGAITPAAAALRYECGGGMRVEERGLA